MEGMRLRELNIGFVAYSPLGRGFLTGQITDPDALVASDRRRQMPRFTGEALDHNLALLEALREIAAGRGARSAPDGYTFYLAGLSVVATNKWMFKELPYNPEKDFASVAVLTD